MIILLLLISLPMQPIELGHFEDEERICYSSCVDDQCNGLCFYKDSHEQFITISVGKYY